MSDFAPGLHGHANCRCPKPKPTPTTREGTGPEVFALVGEDLAVRARVGMDTYGVPLRCHNGRDPLWDAYEEALDLVVYLRQAITEKQLDTALS